MIHHSFPLETQLIGDLLQVLTQEKNPGIKYEYLLPINTPHSSSSEENNSVEIDTEAPPSIEPTENSVKTESDATNNRRKRKYWWKVVSFSPCTKSCGGGIQTPIIRCVRENPMRFFVQKRCAHLPKPVLNENLMRCNTQPCPAYWKIDEWSSCNCGQVTEQLHQQREVKCVQELGTGIVIAVHDGACLEELPAARQQCSCPSKVIAGKLDTYKHHSHKHHHKHRNGAGNLRSPATIIGNTTISKKNQATTENKKAGIWLASEWNQQCSTECGDGIQYRSIFCDRSTPNIERCDLKLTPDTMRQCTTSNHCDVGDWFIGPWSQCAGDCFNLTRSRSVFCIKDELVVPDANCIDSNDVEANVKPNTLEKCNLTDVPDCRPKWHYSEWTEVSFERFGDRGSFQAIFHFQCTKNCGSGTQRRTVKCLEPNLDDLQMKDSYNCKYIERLPAFRSCNVQGCEGGVAPITITTTTTKEPLADPKVDLVQNDITPGAYNRF